MTPAHRTLRTILDDTVRAKPDGLALAMVDGSSVTYAQLGHQAAALSRFLHDRGIRRGDRVVILGENSPMWGIAYFGVTRMGAVAVPILPDFHTADISRIIRHCEASAIFVSRRLYEKLADLSLQEKAVVVLLDDLTVIVPGTAEDDLDRPVLPRVYALDTAAGHGARDEEEPGPDDLAAIVYTSGTTGHSKGVMLTHHNLVSDAIATVEISGVSGSDRLLSILPLPHTYESTLGLITVVMIGGAVHYLDRAPTAAVLLPALQRIRPTVMLSVPLIIEKIYRAKILPSLTSSHLLRRLYGVTITRKLLNRIAGRKLLQTFGGQLRIFTIGGAPLAPDVELFLREARFPYAIGYGLTETSPLIAGTGPALTRYRSTGPALPGTSIRIASPNPETGEGEIQVKGPTVMKGYYRDPDRTREAFTEDGWLKTGDLGVFDADGYLYIKGRLKNMILGPSGKNIYPEELEAIINEFDTVSESIVYEQQNRIVALVHLDYEKLRKALQTISETDFKKRADEMLASLHRQINERIPSYARVHKVIEHEEPFQKTPTQKIKRHLYVPGMSSTPRQA